MLRSCVAAGYRLFDAEGREYLDFLSQYGALPFGHNPPELWEALAARPGRAAALDDPAAAAGRGRAARRSGWRR